MIKKVNVELTRQEAEQLNRALNSELFLRPDTKNKQLFKAVTESLCSGLREHAKVCRLQIFIDRLTRKKSFVVRYISEDGKDEALSDEMTYKACVKEAKEKGGYIHHKNSFVCVSSFLSFQELF